MSLKMNKQKIIVIGSGFAGLTAACFMAKSGYQVTILEKNTTAGGESKKI
jgi:phytoene desaturase